MISIRSRDSCKWLHNQECGSLSNDDSGDGNENGKKTVGLYQKKYNFARASRFLSISSLSLNDYDVKVPNLTFFVGHEHNTTAFFVFSRTSIQSFRIQLQKNLLSTFDELNEME